MNPGMAFETKRIVTPVAVAVEGLDYCYALLSQIKDDPELQDVQLWNYKGDDAGSLKRWLKLFRTLEGFEERIRAIGIIRDAEEDAEKTVLRTIRALTNTGFTAPNKPMEVTATTPSVGFLIMPHDGDSGCLEHAMLEARGSDPRLECVEKYLECVGESGRNENWKAKLKVHALIAAGKNPAWTLGQSVAAGVWDFRHPSLKIMKDFMHVLCGT